MANTYMPKAKRNDHCTPQEVVDLVHQFLGAPFDLDPCGNRNALLLARRSYLIERGDDGLRDPWFGRVFVNPPFNLLRQFAAKAAGSGCEVVFLMPARTDTRAWHDHVATAQAVCFWKGRMVFIGEEDPCPFPVALVYWGQRVEEFSRVFGGSGMVVRLAGC